MKRLTIILFLILAVCIKASAQDALYIVDGQPSTANVKPGDILTTSLMDSVSVLKKYGRSFKDGVTVIITKQYAITQIQQKLSTINKKYKDYLDQKHNDSNLAYVIDNVILNMQKKSAIDKLYELSPEDIKSVSFKRDSHFTTDATVVIATKE